MVIDDKDRLSIFDKNGPYLATKKVGKNNPKAEEIKADNEIRMEWNRAVDRAICKRCVRNGGFGSEKDRNRGQGKGIRGAER